MNKDLVVSVVTITDDYSFRLINALKEATKILSENFQYYEILLLVRKNTIDTLIKLKNSIQVFPKIRLIELAHYCDEDIAYSAGLNSAIGDAVILIDFNQDSLAIVPAMVKKSLEADGVVIVGRNIGETKESLWSKCLAKFFYQFTGFLCEQAVDFERTHFSCYSRTVINFMLQHKSNIRNLRLLRQFLGLETIAFEYEGAYIQRPQSVGFMKRFFSRMEEVFSLSVKPLRVIAAAGFFLATADVFFIFYILLSKLFDKNVSPEWIILSLTHSVVFLFLFLSSSVISCYLNVVLQEIQRRPLYTVANEFFSDNMLYEASNKNVVDS